MEDKVNDRTNRWLRVSLVTAMSGALLSFGLGVQQCGEDPDGDGFTEEEGDCDNYDAWVYPGATEVCDEKDNDCDGALDEGTDCTGVLVTIAGTGLSGYNGDGGQARDSELTLPYGVASNPAGGFYIADTHNNRVRRVDSSGIISTVAGTGVAGYSGDGGPGSEAQVSYPRGVAVGASGSLYIADSSNNRIRRVDASGVISTFAGNGTAGYSGDGGAAVDASLSYPSGIAVGPRGDVYVADAYNHVIRLIDTAGTIWTVAGNGSAGYSGDGSEATEARLNAPADVTVDDDGVLYIADTMNYRVRRVTSSGTIFTIAGSGIQGFEGDGELAVAARLNQPDGVAADPDGRVFVADTDNHRIRMVDREGFIFTVAGGGSALNIENAGAALETRLDYPEDVSIDGSGRLYIADSANLVVRRVYPAW